jgi:hypothetical protein
MTTTTHPTAIEIWELLDRWSATRSAVYRIPEGETDPDLWANHFAADRRLREALGADPYEPVGILPPEYAKFGGRAELNIPTPLSLSSRPPLVKVWSYDMDPTEAALLGAAVAAAAVAAGLLTEALAVAK